MGERAPTLRRAGDRLGRGVRGEGRRGRRPLLRGGGAVLVAGGEGQVLGLEEVVDGGGEGDDARGEVDVARGGRDGDDGEDRVGREEELRLRVAELLDPGPAAKKPWQVLRRQAAAAEAQVSGEKAQAGVGARAAHGAEGGDGADERQRSAQQGRVVVAQRGVEPRAQVAPHSARGTPSPPSRWSEVHSRCATRSGAFPGASARPPRAVASSISRAASAPRAPPPPPAGTRACRRASARAVQRRKHQTPRPRRGPAASGGASPAVRIGKSGRCSYAPSIGPSGVLFFGETWVVTANMYFCSERPWKIGKAMRETE